MTKKSFTTVAIVGILVLASTLTFAQTFRPAAQSTNPQPGVVQMQSTVSGSAVLPRPGTRPPQIIPITKLPIEVRAYNSLTATQGLVNDLNTLIQQGELTFCPAQLAVLQLAVNPILDAVNQLSAASTEYDNQMALAQDQRDWTNFWLLINAAYSDFNTASGYYDQAIQTPC